MDEDKVSQVNYALAQNEDGKWAALFTASNKSNPLVGNERMMSEWFDTREEAEQKIEEIAQAFSGTIKVMPLKRPV